MKKIEFVFTFLAICSVSLRMLSIEGGILFSTISLGVLWLLYLFLSLVLFNDISLKNMFSRDAYKNTSWKRVTWSILTGIFLAIGIAGFLFKLNQWPGGAMMQVVSAFVLLLIAAISLIRCISSPSKFHSGILIRSGVLIIANIILMVFR